MRRVSFFIALGVVLSFSCARARADVKIALETGWGNFYRAAKWNPVFVTLVDDAPREVSLAINAPYDRRYTMEIRQGLTIGPTPVKVPIYVPLSWSLDATTVTVAAAGSGRQLAYTTLAERTVYEQRTGPSTDPVGVTADQLLVGLSGNPSSERLVESQFSSFTNTRIGFMQPVNLPTVPVGYDALDLLVLNQPDLARMPEDQQRAIVDWVRSGGNLLLWPGPAPIPATSPLVDALPCRIGETQQIQLDPRVVKSAGLPERFSKLTGRTLAPMPGAVAVKMFYSLTYASTATSKAAATQWSPVPSGYRGRAGFGQIVVLPVDVSLFRFDTNAKAESFWRRQLTDVVKIPQADKNTNNNTNYGYYSNALDAREQNAITRAMENMGSVAGAGVFGFSYIAAVLVGMMVLVGPVDWFVLKMLKRQPWTWVTTAGWAGLVTLGAIMVGHTFKSGDLHFRTMSVVDEADGARVAATDLAAIYSPKTTTYEIDCDPESWWKPASEQVGWGRGGLQIDIPCHQDYHGNRLLPLNLSVWNLRFIEGTTYAAQPAMVEAALTSKVDPKLGRRVINGTITNRSTIPLRGFVIRTSEGAATWPREVAPGETTEVSAKIDTQDKQFAVPTNPQPYWNPGATQMPPTTASDIALAGDLAAGRSLDIDELLKKYRDTACVYAKFTQPPETVKLTVDGARREHFGVVRSMVKIQRQ